MISSHNPFHRLGCLLAVLALFVAVSLKADVLQLVNGDSYHGKVVSMDSINIEFLSEIQGRVHVPRDKVAQIVFREVVARPIARINTPAAPVTAAPLILSGPTTPAVASAASDPAAPATAEAVVEQMRKQGVQPQLMNQVQEQIFGKGSPEASQKFEEIMSGLMSGQISVQGLRAQAQDAIKQARDAKKELGGDAGDMLDGYIGILEKFVAESAPAPAPATTVPRATASSAAPLKPAN